MFPGPGGPGDAGYGGAGYGGAGYQAPGYGPPGFDHPYQGTGGAPYGDATGAVPPRFPGGAGHAPPPGQQFAGQQFAGQQFAGQQFGSQQFAGQPPMPPGYAHDPSQGPRTQPPGWYRPEGAPPYGESRGPDGQSPRGASGQAGPGQAGYASPGYPGAGGFPRGNGYPGPAGQAAGQGRSPFPGQPGYPVADGFEGRAEQQAPYPEYQAWQARGGPGAYVGPEGYGETVNGGGYAYVIREDDPGMPPSRPRATEWGQGPTGPAPGRAAPPGGPARAGTSSGGSAQSARSARSGEAADRVRAITAGAVSAGWSDSAGRPAETANPEAAADVDPYGPDDPAYGPPGPDWHKRDEQRRTKNGESPPVSAEPRAVRGPFEPLRPGDRQEAGYADYPSADAEPAFDEPDADLGESGTSEYQPIDYEMSDLLDFGTPTDPEAGALGQITDLYQTAERISPAALDSHFEQLLERQRELIAEYFQESGGLASAGAAQVPEAEPSAPVIPLGFDTVESLAGLRNELRSTQ